MIKAPFYHRIFSGAAALMVASVVAFGFMVLAQTTTAEAYNDEQSRWQSVAKSKPSVAAAMNLMEENKLLKAIEENGGNYVNELTAMAIHEADGRLGIVNGGSLAYCAFQIAQKNIPSFSREAGMSEKAYIHALKTDPVTCTKAGLKDLREKIRISGYERGICNYGGQVTALAETGTCPLYAELKIIMGLLDGTLTQEVVTDKDSPDYGNIIIKDGGGEIVTTLNCQDRSRSLARALRKANDAYMTTAFQTGEEEAVRLNERDSGRGGSGVPLKELKGKFFDTYCLKGHFDYFNVLRLLISKGQMLEAALMLVVDQLMKYACNYAMAVVTSAVSNVLNKFCLAMPSLNLGLNFGSTSGGSCSGLSLGDLFAVGYGHLDPAAVAAGTLSWPAGVGLPPVNGMITGRTDAPPLFLDLRRQ